MTLTQFSRSPHCKDCKNEPGLHSYLLNQLVDFDKTYTETPLGHGKEMVRFWWPWPLFHMHIFVCSFWTNIFWTKWWILAKPYVLYFWDNYHLTCSLRLKSCETVPTVAAVRGFCRFNGVPKVQPAEDTQTIMHARLAISLVVKVISRF